jgi:hypothetical protein
MSHPVSPPDGDDRPSNGQSTLHPDTAATARLDRPIDQVRPGTDPGTVRSTRADEQLIGHDDRSTRSLTSSESATTPTSTEVPVTDRAGVVARQRERFGGIKAGSAFFGWLTATGMSVLLIALLAAGGVAFGVATNTTVSVDQAVQESEQGTGTAQTVGLVGAITLLVVLLVAYYCGGYVAGRMARFNGAKQGLAVWLWGVLMALLIAAVAAIAGAQYDVFAQLNLPRLPVNEGQVTAVGAIAIGAAILAALLGAVLGGLAGMRFHRKVDNAGLETPDHPAVPFDDGRQHNNPSGHARA